MSKFKSQLVTNLLDLSEGLQSTSNLSCTILLLSTYMFYTLILLNFKTIAGLLFIPHNKSIFDTLLYVLISINFFFMFFFGINLTLKSAKVN